MTFAVFVLFDYLFISFIGEKNLYINSIRWQQCEVIGFLEKSLIYVSHGFDSCICKA